LQKFYEQKHLFRLNWWQRTTAAAFKVLNFSYKNDVDVFDIPPRQDFMQFRIVVSTCSVAGCLINDSTCDPFDVVIIDEISQAIEAEALVPVSLCKLGGCIVVAGDSEQLGANPRSPVFHNSTAIGSLLDRLLRTEFYDNLKENSSIESKTFRFGTFLRRNYRSHRDIFSVSSNMFYGGFLVESADPDVINR
jgi:superfamily I DNA and/or RNA helicase